MERPRIYEQHQYRGLRRVDANDHALNSKVTKSEKNEQKVNCLYFCLLQTTTIISSDIRRPESLDTTLE